MKRLEKILKNLFENDESLDIKPDLKFQDIDGFNSLTFLEMVAAVEDEYAIQLDIEELVAITNVEDLLSILSKDT